MHITTQVTEGTAKISISGRFDFNMSREFKNAYDAHISSAAIHEIDIDLGKVDYLDSSALGMLLILKDRVTAANKRLKLTHCTGIVKQVLDIARFDKLFDIS